jgi:hypothetical protein
LRASLMSIDVEAREVCGFWSSKGLIQCSPAESPDNKFQPLRLLIRAYLHPNPEATPSCNPTHPSVLIHKHSRANAFSIFRANKLRTAHMSKTHCILLAPLKVQVHYTETRSMRALKSYKPLGKKVLPDDKENSCSNKCEQRNPPELIDIQEHTSTSPPPVAEPSALGVSPQAVLSNSPPSPQRALISPLPDEEDEQDKADDLNGKCYARKYHADAFATLDEKQLEAQRQTRLVSSEPVPIPIAVNRVRQSRFGTDLKCAFAGTPVHPAANDDINGGVFNPPWLTIRPRVLQEKNAMTFHQLNRSFEDAEVGQGGLVDIALDPLGIAGKTGNTNGKSWYPCAQRRHGEAFRDILKESPAMLLPMWANEGAEGGARKDYVGFSSIPMHERRYLLIYYTPFAPADDQGHCDTKEHTRPAATNGDVHRSASERDKHQGEHFISFRAVAKVLSYDDAWISGLRLPNQGIEILPSSPAPCGVFPSLAPVRSTFSESDTTVIAIFPSPESAIEFIPEGLEKLGLCYGPGEVLVNSITNPVESERLNPIGRAVVEMAWVGCLCVMGLVSTL